MKFTGVELAASVEKGMIGPVEKAAAGLCAGEAHGGREARWRGRKTGCHALARRRCRPTEERHDGGRRGGEGSTVESVVTEEARRSGEVSLFDF